MNNKWKWLFGFGLAVIILLTLLFVSIFFAPNGGYLMMAYGYGRHMPMMYYGGDMIGLGMRLFMWQVSLAWLALIGIGIAWLAKTLAVTK